MLETSTGAWLHVFVGVPGGIVWGTLAGLSQMRWMMRERAEALGGDWRGYDPKGK